MEVSALEFPRENIYVTIHAGVKTARRKVVSTKEFIKAKVHSQGGRGAGCLRWLQGCFGIGYFLHLFELGGAVATVGWSLLEADSNNLGQVL